MMPKNPVRLVGFVLCFVSAQLQASCEFLNWVKYKETQLYSHPNSSAYLFTSSHMAVNADGAPNAYHPSDIGLDYLANAGYPNSDWWQDVLVVSQTDPQKAYVQPSGEHQGYFLSKTSLQDKSKSKTDTQRYVDARKIPYFVFPGNFYTMQGTGRLGDLGFAINRATGDKSAFVVADVGPKKASLGEISIALAESLGGVNVDPRTGSGAPRGDILYVIFPYTTDRLSWPLTEEDIQLYAGRLLSSVGGVSSVLTCEP